MRNLNTDGRYQIIVCIRQKGQKSQENVPELICDLEDEFEPIEDENDEKIIDLDQDISDTTYAYFQSQIILESIYPFEEVADQID